MTGIITAQNFSFFTGGVFVSELDTDPSFVEKGNPKGYFRMVISPIEHEIRYLKKSDNTVRVYGEAWMITGNKQKIERDVAKLFEDLKEDVVQFVNEETYRQYRITCKSETDTYIYNICGKNKNDAIAFFRKLSANEIIGIEEVEFHREIDELFGNRNCWLDF